MRRFNEGFLVQDRYRLVERIASGGMGDVWRGTDEVLARTVAVKIMKPDAAAEPVYAQRFKDEAMLTAGLSHHNIARLLDYGTHDSIAFLIMEFVEGRPLSALASRSGMDAGRVRSIIGQVALALQAAHDAGVVHRDIKPGNILVTSDGVVKLTDFGIARAQGSAALTRTGEMIGTPNYLSPEQALGRQATGASDLYALGVVALELLTGTRPFERDTPIATALAHVNDPLPTIPLSVPADLIDVIDRCLRKEPADRPASAREVAVALGIPWAEVAVPEHARPPELVAAGRAARFFDLVVPSGSAVLLAGADAGELASDLAVLGHRTAVLILGEPPDLDGPASADVISVDAPEDVLSTRGPFEAIGLLGFLADVVPTERSEVLRRLGARLTPTGRLVVTFAVTADYPYTRFRDDFLTAGLVPDLALADWNLRPSAPDASSLIAVLSRR